MFSILRPDFLVNENLTLAASGETSTKTDSGLFISLGNAGTPSLFATPGETPIIGTVSDDYLSKPGITDDTLIGLQGADTLLSYGGVDILFGDTGNDLLFSGNLADWLYGDGGNDTLYGEEGWDFLYADNEVGIIGDDETSRNLLLGGEGADQLFGSLGFDTLYGGNDEDTLTGGGGADWLHGGAGADLVLIDLSSNPNIVSRFDAANTIADFSLSEGDTLSLGLIGGMLAGPSGPAQLMWRGSLLAPSGPVAGFVLPGTDLGEGYLQAWLLISSPETTARGGWIVIDLDRNGVIGAPDILFLLQSVDLQARQIFRAVDPASFAGWAGNGEADVLEARASGSRLFGLGGADVLLGGNGNDCLSGGDGQDTLAGDAGNDQLWGGTGDDWLLGGNGNDALYAHGPDSTENDVAAAINRLEGEAGDDSLYGGLGSDWLLGGADRDSLYGDDGTDSLEGGSGNDTLLGGNGTDSLNGGTGTDSIVGGSGDDTIAYGEISDRLIGGDGFDWLVILITLSFNLSVSENQALNGAWVAGFEAVDANAASGSVTLLGGMESNCLISGSGSDSLYGNAGDDILQAGMGNDSLAGGSGLNIMTGGTGADLYFVDSSDDLVLEAYLEGNDSIIASVDFYLPPEVEFLILAPGSAAIRGGGGLGHDRLIGNANSNQLLGSDGNDTLEGGDGTDTLEGGEQNDVLIGGNQADMLSGDVGQDSLDGGAGNDTLSGGEGADTLAGGVGDDLYFIDSVGDLMLEASASGIDTVIATVDIDLPSGIEFLILAPGSAAISSAGGVGHDRLVGNANANHLLGADGNDTLEGGAGDDTLYAEGADSLSGGDGTDAFIFQSLADLTAVGRVVDGGAGVDRIEFLFSDAVTDAAFVNMRNLESVWQNAATPGSLTLGTNAAAAMSNYIVVYNGRDVDGSVLAANIRADFNGTTGNDTLIGGAGFNFLFGGAGDDVILVGGQSLNAIRDEFEGWI
jgi:Ca2+-binding RTX toxin-like protein